MIEWNEFTQTNMPQKLRFVLVKYISPFTQKSTVGVGYFYQYEGRIARCKIWPCQKLPYDGPPILWADVLGDDFEIMTDLEAESYLQPDKDGTWHIRNNKTMKVI